MSIKKVLIKDFKSSKKQYYKEVPLTYQVFGKKIGTAKIILVNHALTGNSEVSGDNGWWKSLISSSNTIDTDNYTVIAFDIPNNDYNIRHSFEYNELNISDISKLFALGLKEIGIENIFICIGSSLGGYIAWEMSVQYPNLINNIIPIASDWKSSDWILSMSSIQNSILKNSSKPIEDARKMAMLFYRTPESFSKKFNRTINIDENKFNVITWIEHHGEKLSKRFSLKAYKTMNYLMGSADITNGEGGFLEKAKEIKSNIFQIGVDTDILFKSYENKNTHKDLIKIGKSSEYYEIKSIHGHDAFLIEYKQLHNILKQIINKINNNESI